jgi:hypothetical protein
MVYQTAQDSANLPQPPRTPQTSKPFPSLLHESTISPTPSPHLSHAQRTSPQSSGGLPTSAQSRNPTRTPASPANRDTRPSSPAAHPISAPVSQIELMQDELSTRSIVSEGAHGARFGIIDWRRLAVRCAHSERTLLLLHSCRYGHVFSLSRHGDSFWEGNCDCALVGKGTWAPFATKVKRDTRWGTPRRD